MSNREVNIIEASYKKSSNIYWTCWVIALRAEAISIIRLFNMKKVETHSSFQIYASKEAGHALIISGIGAIKSAAATAYLKAQLDIESYAAWINLGIAGYYKEPIGKFFQAVKVYSQERNRTFFPGFRFSKKVAGASLLTLNKTEKIYEQPLLYDMEASGFCEIASKFSCNELVFVFKIVSDTPESSTKKITGKTVEELVEVNLLILKGLLSEIEKLSKIEMNRLTLPEEVFEMENSINFSKTNSHKFRQLYKRWKFIHPEKSLKELNLSAKKAKEIINFLKKDISLNMNSRNFL